jgi:diguanylate cyclase (GGDEF)-like protein
MRTDKIASHKNEQIDNKITGGHEKAIYGLKIIIPSILLLLSILSQLLLPSPDFLFYCLAQFQIIITAFLVILTNKNGYISALGLNVVYVIIIAFRPAGETSSFAQRFLFTLCAIAVATIIYLSMRHLKNRLQSISSQKEKISTLYDNNKNAVTELNQQNDRLIESNLIYKQKEESLISLVYYDSLTGLPDIKMITKKATHLISSDTNRTNRFAIAIIDVDNFKTINSAIGHRKGNLLLQAVVTRLKERINPDDILGRLYGDVFAVIIEQPLKRNDLLKYAESLRACFSTPVSIKNNLFNMTVSIGISIYPQDGIEFDELLRCADEAMYKAKDSGKNAIRLFDNSMEDEIISKIEFRSKLQSAVKNDELFLAFQPQYDVASKQLRGFEALVRWDSPELGIISPVKFIPVAEQTGLIVPIGEWILRKSCEKFKSILDTFNYPALLSVNISAVQIMEPSFLQMVGRVLEETEFDTKNLEFEITESVFISSMDYVISVLNEIKKMGINIALDDFGTGYSSLNYLQMLPIDTLKIDKAFIDSIINTKAEKQIVGSIISLVHKMDISVVAEGVENEEQLDYLKNQQCDFIQGYLWGKPLSDEQLNQLLQSLSHREE